MKTGIQLCHGGSLVWVCPIHQDLTTWKSHRQALVASLGVANLVRTSFKLLSRLFLLSKRSSCIVPLWHKLLDKGWAGRLVLLSIINSSFCVFVSKPVVPYTEEHCSLAFTTHSRVTLTKLTQLCPNAVIFQTIGSNNLSRCIGNF